MRRVNGDKGRFMKSCFLSISAGWPFLVMTVVHGGGILRAGSWDLPHCFLLLA